MVDGKVYAIPWGTGPCAVYYKRWIFEKYDIDPASIETWDDFIRVGEELAAKSKGQTHLMPLSAGASTEMFQILMQQNGGGVFDADGRVILAEPANVEALALLGRLLRSSATVPGTMYGPAFLGGLSTDTFACYPAAAWQTQNFKDSAPAETRGKWGVFRLPAFRPGGLRTSNYGGSVLVIPEGAVEPEAGGKFIEYALCTVEAQIEQYRKFGLFPALLPSFDDPYFDEGDPFFGGQNINRLFAMDFEKVPPLTRTIYWNDAERLLSQTLIGFAENNEDPATFLRRQADTLVEQFDLQLAGGGAQ